MASRNVFFDGINRAAWYHLDSSGLLLAVRELSSGGCYLLVGWLGLLVILT